VVSCIRNFRFELQACPLDVVKDKFPGETAFAAAGSCLLPVGRLTSDTISRIGTKLLLTPASSETPIPQPYRLLTPVRKSGKRFRYDRIDPDAILTLQQIMDFCHDRWAEADKAPASDWPTPDMQTGKKMAFNEVLQYARRLLSEAK
jgi:hypothetical protein